MTVDANAATTKPRFLTAILLTDQLIQCNDGPLTPIVQHDVSPGGRGGPSDRSPPGRDLLLQIVQYVRYKHTGSAARLMNR